MKIFTYFAFAAILLTGLVSHAGESNIQAEKDAIKAMVDRYVESVATLDRKDFDELWPTNEEVSVFNAYNWEQGREEVWEDFYLNYLGLYADGKRKLQVEDLNIHVHGDFAWVDFLWKWDATIREDVADPKFRGYVVDEWGRETQVLKKGPDGWQILHIHYSSPPKMRPSVLPTTDYNMPRK